MLHHGAHRMLMKFFRLLDILQPLMFRCPARPSAMSDVLW